MIMVMEAIRVSNSSGKLQSFSILASGQASLTRFNLSFLSSEINSPYEKEREEETRFQLQNSIIHLFVYILFCAFFYFF